MPVAPLWAVLFFIMLFLLGLDSQFATMEGLITVLLDSKTIRKVRKEIVICKLMSNSLFHFNLFLSFFSLSFSPVIACALFFVVSIPFVFGNGIYLFQLFDQFASTLPLLFVGLMEIITISWIFGVDR